MLQLSYFYIYFIIHFKHTTRLNNSPFIKISDNEIFLSDKVFLFFRKPSLEAQSVGSLFVLKRPFLMPQLPHLHLLTNFRLTKL